MDQCPMSNDPDLDLTPAPPGKFRCDACGATFDLGDDPGARPGAEAAGIDPAVSWFVCDDCHESRPWGLSSSEDGL
jgi:hypothetical protein